MSKRSKRMTPKEGEESVWDYPRPPRLEPFTGSITVVHQGMEIFRSTQAFRVLETSHPPVYYLPIEGFLNGKLTETSQQSHCEFKGRATYYDFANEHFVLKNVGWTYHKPYSTYKELKGYVAIYASRVDACYVNDEKVQAQEGDFYGGWITSKVKGPFKGGVGTWGW